MGIEPTDRPHFARFAVARYCLLTSLQGYHPMKKGTLALLIHGGTENWSPERWKRPVRRGVRRPARGAAAGSGARSGRGPLCRGLEAGPGRTGGVSEPARDLQSRRRRRRADGGSSLPEGAAGARRGRRSHHAHDRICRAACADASPPGALSARQPARQTLGAEISMAGERDFGRHHGPGHAGRGRGAGAGAARLSRRRLEPKPAQNRRHRMLSRRRRSSKRSCDGPTSWSACCR